MQIFRFGAALGLAGLLAAAFPATARAQAGPVALESAEAKKVDAFLDAFKAAIDEGTSIAGFFDVDAMITEAGKLGGAKIQPLLANPQFRVGVRQGMSRQFSGERAAVMGWERYKVRRIVKRADGVWVVIYRIWVAENASEKRRWWLQPAPGQPGGFRIVDGEVLEIGVRMTAGMAAAALMLASRDNADALASLQRIQGAMGMLQQGRLAEAAMQAESIPAGVLPKAFEGLRLMILASYAGSQEEAELLLRYIAQAKRMELDAPILLFLEASGLVGVGRAAEAEQVGRRYLAEIGPDPNGYWVVGRALAEQEKAAEAIAMFVKGLDDDPSSLDNFAELVVLWPDGEPQCATRLAKMPNALEAFDPLASLALQEDRYNSLEQLCNGFAKLAPADPSLTYYRAQVVLHRDGDAAKAAGMLDGVLDRAPAEERIAYVREYCYAMLLAGKALDAYKRVPDKAFAFEVMAWELLEKAKQLEALIAAHRPNGADDPWLYYFDAELKVERKEYDAAEALYVKAAALAQNDEAREEIRSSRVYGLFLAGKWKDAYATCAPAGETFRQLARLLNGKGEGKGLEQLCDLHAKADPDEDMVSVWRAEALALQGRHGEALSVARANLDSDDEALVGNATRRSVLSNVALKLWDEALKVAKQSTLRDGDPWWELVVACAKGDAAEAGRIMEHMVVNGTDPDVFWHDEHITKALESNPAFAELKKKYPHQDH